MELHGIWVTLTSHILFPASVPDVKVMQVVSVVPCAPASRYTASRRTCLGKLAVMARWLNSLCIPVLVPQMVGGSVTAGEVTTKVSSAVPQEPSAFTIVEKVRKSKRYWQTSREKEGWVKGHIFGSQVYISPLEHLLMLNLQVLLTSV